MRPTTLAKLEGYSRRFLTASLPPELIVRLYSSQRVKFLKRFFAALPAPYLPAATLSRTLWGINFRAPVFNASGIFKNGEGYELSFRHGAGAFLAGTSTALARQGNEKNGIKLPFAPYPRSHAASNWLGLPNKGDEALAKLLKGFPRHAGYPIGVSIAGAPELPEHEKLKKLIEGLFGYRDAAVDFIELNESCPNTDAATLDFSALRERLTLISTQFLKQRGPSRKPPLTVKFSTDVAPSVAATLVDLLVSLGFDGVNFGNTSTDYPSLAKEIDPAEIALFNYFSSTFGGGVSGRPLSGRSLALTRAAAEARGKLNQKYEFHILRTGGIESWSDVQASIDAGASLVQWYSGYFEQFSRYGHELYSRLFRDVSD